MQPLTTTASKRIPSIDILRGIVMIIMALDHTRDFFHVEAFTGDPLDVNAPTPWLYFTRWITHFCAPTFVMLSGLSAYLSSQRKTKAEASLFLIKRGLWLLFIELVVLSFAFTFNPFYNSFLLQVIWAISISMIILGLLSRISYTVVLIVGLILFCGHDAIAPLGPQQNVLWEMLFTARGTVIPLNANHVIFCLYAALPWTGVMLMGYCAGYFFKSSTPVATRKRFLLITGFTLLTCFVVFRASNIYGDPSPFHTHDHLQATILDFLNVSKYPPSLMYCDLTLGVACLMLLLLENATAAWTSIPKVYGSVPFFYYILHFYLLHTLLVIAFFASGYDVHQIADPKSPFLFRPVQFGYSLPIVYLIWIAVVTALYFPSKWFSQYKKTHHQWWLSYL
jgi:uncharacterized membrane protein